MTIRALLAGAFVLSLATASTARADDWHNHLRSDIRLRAATDGRGDTADFHTRGITVERPTFQRPAVDHSWQRVTSERHTPQIKTSIQVRLGEGGEHMVKLPGASQVTTVKVDQKTAIIQHKKAAPPIKMDILMKVGERRDGSAAQLPENNTATKNSKKADLSKLPIKMSVRMRMHGEDKDNY